MGVFTELSILYSKYRPGKCEQLAALHPNVGIDFFSVMEHLKLFVARINIPKVSSSLIISDRWVILTYGV